MELISFRCTSCKQGLKVGADKAGRRVKCTRCGTVLVIPSASEPTREQPPAPKEETAPTPPPKPAAKKLLWDDDEDQSGGSYGFAEPVLPPPEEPRRKIKDEEDEDEDEDDEEFDEEEQAEKDEELRRRLLGLDDEDEEEEEEEELDEEGKPIKRSRRRGKALLEEPVWQKIRAALIFVVVSLGAVALAVLLHEIVVILGLFAGDEYSKDIFTLQTTFKITPESLENLVREGPNKIKPVGEDAGKISLAKEADRLTLLKDRPYTNLADFKKDVLVNLGYPEDPEKRKPQEKEILNLVILYSSERHPFDTPRFLTCLIAGVDNLDRALTFRRVPPVLMLLGSLAMIAACVFCLSAPPDFAARPLALAALSLAGVNLLLGLIFRLLPLVGAMQFVLYPLLGPELAMLSANEERDINILALWTPSPYLQFFAAALIIGLQFMEFVLFPLFLRSLGKFLKSEALENTGLGLAKIGLGQIFMQFAYLVLAPAGASDVQGWVLKGVYCIGLGFFIGQLAWYMVVLINTRALIQKRLDRQAIENE